MLLCVMMIRAEGVFKKKTVENQDVLHVMHVCKRERGTRFKDTEDEMCDMR